MLRLHKVFGVNPTVPVCLYCGESKNEVILLGARYKGKAPSSMVINDVPCDKCKEKFKQGITLFEVSEQTKTRTGNYLVIKEEALERILQKDSDIYKVVLAKRFANVDHMVFNELI
jgi:hypothetical protein